MKKNKSKITKDTMIIIRCEESIKKKIRNRCGKESMSQYMLDRALSGGDKEELKDIIPDAVRCWDAMNSIYHRVAQSGDERLIGDVRKLLERAESQMKHAEEGIFYEK